MVNHLMFFKGTNGLMFAVESPQQLHLISYPESLDRAVNLLAIEGHVVCILTVSFPGLRGDSI
jgi:hypothetical protein